ncbi:MAG: sugar ABC transporter ATP-binding protein [Lachnospiraceae bacterium]|nr:sugar ABC transporter ATP-binding protein [Lachnospiraceae bacterium]
MADLEIKGLSKAFGGVKALQNVNFQAAKGEVHALLGENGAGKSTLIKCLGACQSYDSGEIYLNGKKLVVSHPRQAMEAGIGIIFQELSLIPNLSVADNLFLGMKLGNKTSVTRKKIACQKARQIFEEFQVEGIEPEQKVESLSLSEKQTIEIVKVLSRNTEVIVFDEATSALTANRVEWLFGLVERLREQKKIIIFISHRMGEIRRFCNVVTVFRNGQNVGTKPLEEVENDELVQMMLGRKIAGYYPEKVNTCREEIALETKDLFFEHYLDQINIKLKFGEVVGIGGLAGQGQNALLLALSGAVRVQKGEIFLGGKPVSMKNPKQAMAQGVSLVPEERATEGLVLELSIADNLLLPVVSHITRWGLINRKKEQELLEHAVDSLSIKVGDIENPVNSLSGGNQQKVVLAKLMMTHPKVLLLYDFTRGVDVGTKNTMFTLLRKLAADGNCILFYSTDMEELVNVCDRVLVMDQGAVKADLSGELLTEENILKASIGDGVA